MKKKNLLLLSLVALSLAGCNNTPSNSTTSGNSTSVVQSDKTSTSTKKSDTSTSTKKTDTTSSALTDDYESSKWPTAVKNDMLQYLDNTLLPYIDLGGKDVRSVWNSDTDTLEISGKASEVALTADEITAAKTTYEKNGWSVTTDATSMTAKNDEKGTITVKYYNNDTFNVLEATYKEPFDESKAATAWPTKIVEEMNTNLNNHGADVPYVYLGSVNPTYSWDEAHVTFKITGGTWDDKITTLAKTAFEAANATITNQDNKWVIDEIGDNIYGKTFNASICFSDGTKLAVSIEAPDTEAGKKAYMNIVYTQPFGGTSTAWNDDITDWEAEYADDHSIPFFYCGTESDDLNVQSASSTSLRIYGENNTWDDRVIDNFKNAINTENTKITSDDKKWTITSKTSDSNASVTAWIATRKFDDNCSLTIKVEEDQNNRRADILVQYEKGYNPTATDWGTDTKQSFTDYLDGNKVPYIYLGNDDPEDDSVDWDDIKTLTITGSEYFSAVLDGANNAFNAADGWTSSIVTKTGTNYDGTKTYSYQVVEAEYIINATTGKKLNATVKAEYYNTNTGTPYGRCVMEIVYTKPYEVPTDPEDLKWDTAAANYISYNFSNHALPFVYLNASTVTTNYYYSENAMYITGGAWDDKVLDHALTQITGATKTTEEDDDGNTQNVVKATLTETDGCTIDITIHNVYGSIEYKAVLNETYNYDDTLTAWDTETATKISAGLNGNTLPFINFGTKHLTVNNYTNQVKIETHVWDDEIITKTVAKVNGVDGWVCVKNEFEDRELSAFKKLADGSKVTFKLNNLGTGVQFLAYYTAASTTTITKTKSAWSEKDKTNIKAITGTTEIPNIPFLYMGESDYATYNKAIRGNVYDLDTMYDYYQALKDAGYQKVCFKVSANQLNLTAEYTDASGNVTKLVTKYFAQGWGSSAVKGAELQIAYTPATNA